MTLFDDTATSPHVIINLMPGPREGRNYEGKFLMRDDDSIKIHNISKNLD